MEILRNFFIMNRQYGAIENCAVICRGQSICTTATYNILSKSSPIPCPCPCLCLCFHINVRVLSVQFPFQFPCPLPFPCPFPCPFLYPCQSGAMNIFMSVMAIILSIPEACTRWCGNLKGFLHEREWAKFAKKSWRNPISRALSNDTTFTQTISRWTVPLTEKYL